jgi:hypothetical protein
MRKRIHAVSAPLRAPAWGPTPLRSARVKVKVKIVGGQFPALAMCHVSVVRGHVESPRVIPREVPRGKHALDHLPVARARSRAVLGA